MNSVGEPIGMRMADMRFEGYAFRRKGGYRACVSEVCGALAQGMRLLLSHPMPNGIGYRSSVFVFLSHPMPFGIW